MGAVPPPTLIRDIQEVGLDLGIAPKKLTMERLMANPDDDKEQASDD